ncbi:MAG: alpha/beta hydrolase [Clostridiaceae bacterium]|jgi:Predicted hydrolases or acyltransferases (alpha/beta hydrolase superfamily)
MPYIENYMKVCEIMMEILCALPAGLLFLTAFLLIRSPGKTHPFLDANKKEIAGSISEKTFVEINGIRQGMFIRGKNTNNPMVLFVHGGPGMPEYFLAEKYMMIFEERFTVCYWDQRGSGISYRSNSACKSITTEQLIADAIAVTNYLRKRFGQEKIYLMAHSWGTFLGIQAAAHAPELYHAYIGIAQVSQQQESEKMAYQYMLSQYKASGNQAKLKKLKDYSDYLANPSLRDEAMHELGIGTMHNMRSVFTGIFLPVMQCRAYTLTEKINIWRGKAALNNVTDLRRQMSEADMIRKVSKLKIPAYFFSGVYDYTVSYILAESYFKQLQVHVKGFYLFRQSAHSPVFEEPEKAVCIMLEDVLAGKNSLSDIK